MNKNRLTSWSPFRRRRADYCRRLALMQRDPSLAQALSDLARRYETEAAPEAGELCAEPS